MNLKMRQFEDLKIVAFCFKKGYTDLKTFSNLQIDKLTN